MPDNSNMDRDEVSFSYKPPEKKRRRKKSGFGKGAAIAAVLVLLCGSVAAAALSGMIGRGDTPAVAESKPESSADEKAESSAEESEEPEEDPKPQYTPTGEFKADLNKLPAKVRKKLSEDITSEFVVLYDMTEDKILFQKNSTKKCYPASTTKMLTAIVSSQILDKDTEITVGNEIKLIGEDSSTAGLVKGMKMTYEMLLDALLLPSGNDAAYTIAVNTARVYSGDEKLSDKEAVKVFMELVNDAAKQIGCKKTHFVTPDGWHDDDHYTSAEDLARIGAYVKSIPIVSESCAKSYAKWELLNEPVKKEESKKKTSDKKKNDEDEENGFPPEEFDIDYYGNTIEWYNSNALLLWDSGMYSEYADGLKTGFTDQAGTSVVASATMDGHTMIAVVMNSPSLYTKYNEANMLFEQGFKLYKLKYTYGS